MRTLFELAQYYEIDPIWDDREIEFICIELICKHTVCTARWYDQVVQDDVGGINLNEIAKFCLDHERRFH